MGGNFVIVMNLFCFLFCLDMLIMYDIFVGGYDKVRELGVVIVGGYIIVDFIFKYGFCVSGFVYLSEIFLNSNVKIGDVFILIKLLGIGVMNIVVKVELFIESKVKEIVVIMFMLNKYVKECMFGFDVYVCIDIIGFSLIGYSYEMVSGSSKIIEIFSDCIFIIDEVLDYVKMGIIFEGMYNNFDYLKDKFILVLDIK